MYTDCDTLAPNQITECPRLSDIEGSCKA